MSQPNKQFKDTLKWLLDEGYVKVDDTASSIVLTEKFQGQCSMLVTHDFVIDTISPLVIPATARLAEIVAVGNLKLIKDWPMFFIKFITDAKVPQKLEAGNGEVYYANKYSEPAMKVFKKALESGCNYEVLLRSVQLYYGSGVRYKKAIGNYFVQGDWKSGYEDMMNAASAGKAELTQHIKEQADDGKRSHLRIG